MLPVSGNILERLRVEIKREAFSLYDNYSFWDELNISKEEHVALKGLSTNKDFIIQKFYHYSKFTKLDVKQGKENNSLLQQEDRLTNIFKKVERSISDQLYKEL